MPRSTKPLPAIGGFVIVATAVPGMADNSDPPRGEPGSRSLVEGAGGGKGPPEPESAVDGRNPAGIVTDEGEYIPPKPQTRFDSGGTLPGYQGKPGLPDDVTAYGARKPSPDEVIRPFEGEEPDGH